MAKYPKYLNQVRDLVEQHRELVEEPLLLAIYYAPDRDPEDVFLFEILDNFRGGALDASGDILEADVWVKLSFLCWNRETRKCCTSCSRTPMSFALH